MSTNGKVLLEASDLVAGFGLNTILHGVSFRVYEGEIAAILGLNGAGKSVTMKVLGGIVPARTGRISLGGRDITGNRAEERVEAGMAHVPQGRQVFPELTVEQNLRIGAYTLRRKNKSEYGSALDSVFGRFPILKERRHQAAGTLSGGEQAMLAVARALLSAPRIILVDEASAGLSPIMVNEVFRVLKEVNESGVTILMVEQNVTFTLRIADRAHIMQSGRIMYEGDVPTLDRDRVASYLGVGQLLGSRVSAAAAARQMESGSQEVKRKSFAKKTSTKKRSTKKATAKPKPSARKVVSAKRKPSSKGTR